MTDSENVRVALTGAVYRAPVDAPAPTDASTPLSSDWLPLGYISEDGVSKRDDNSNNDIKAWQNSAIVRTVVTDQVAGLGFTMIETNKTTLETFHPGSEVVANGAEWMMEMFPITPKRYAWVVDAVDGDVIIRHYLKSGEVISREEVELSNDGVMGWGVEVRGYPVNGSYGHKFSNDDAWGQS